MAQLPKATGKIAVNQVCEAAKKSAQLKGEIHLNSDSIPVAVTVILASESWMNSAGWFASG
jgi:hypothetical protein